MSLQWSGSVLPNTYMYITCIGTQGSSPLPPRQNQGDLGGVCVHQMRDRVSKAQRHTCMPGGGGGVARVNTGT